MPTATSPQKNIICRQCREVAPQTGPRQFYCAPCSDARHRERQAAYSKTSKPKQRAAKHQRACVDGAREAGALASVEAARSLSDIELSKGFRPRWYVRLRVPNAGTASKNYIFGFAGPHGHVYKRKQANAFQAALALEVKEAVKNLPVVNNKVWIEVLVQKENHKSDAVNVVDLVCDAVKLGLGVDDRWFSIARLDWEIVKTEPDIFIGIFQEETEHAQSCSTCGRIAPLADFPLKPTAKYGRHRVCFQCIDAGRALVRARKVLNAAEAQL